MSLYVSLRDNSSNTVVTPKIEQKEMGDFFFFLSVYKQGWEAALLQYPAHS